MKQNNLTKISSLSELERQKRFLRDQIDLQEQRIDMDVTNIRRSFDDVRAIISHVRLGFDFVKSLFMK